MPARLKLLPILTLAFLAVLPAANALRPALDADTWWHLRIGGIIAQTGEVPRTDPISRLGIDGQIPWVAYSWLHEWLLAIVHDRFDAPGVLACRSLLVGFSTGIVLAFVGRRFNATFTGFAVALGITVTLHPMATERPWHYSIAFTTLCLAHVQTLRAGGSLRSTLWLVPLFAVWANLHIQFVYGWFVLVLACLDPGQARRRNVALLTAGCFAATLLNPYHLRLFGVILEYGTDSTPGRIIQELAPPDPFAPWSLAALLLVGWAAVSLIRRRPVPWFEIGLLVVGAALASRMNRDLWFGALTAAAVIPTKSEPTAKSWIIVPVALGVSLVLRFAFPADSRTAHERVYPARAVAAIRELKPAGPLFNDITWGGYLAWNLPEYPVTIDGRTNLHGGTRLLQSDQTWSTRDGWKNDPDLAPCNLVVAGRTRTLTDVLRSRPEEWRVIFEDDVTVVFGRRGSGH